MRQLSDDLSQISAGTFGMQYVHTAATYSMAMLDELNNAPELPKLEPGHRHLAAAQRLAVLRSQGAP